MLQIGRKHFWPLVAYFAVIGAAAPTVLVIQGHYMLACLFLILNAIVIEWVRPAIAAIGRR